MNSDVMNNEMKQDKSIKFVRKAFDVKNEIACLREIPNDISVHTISDNVSAKDVNTNTTSMVVLKKMFISLIENLTKCMKFHLQFFSK